MIYAAPAVRFECAYSIDICARCLTFPTPEMDELADRIICYMAQHPDDATATGAQLTRPLCRAWQRDGGLCQQAPALDCTLVNGGRDHGGLARGSRDHFPSRSSA
eukprot:4800293-Prymnesium_polylepis.1